MLDFISDNIKKVRDEIFETCLKYSRNTGDITLCAVSKTKPIEYIDFANTLGINTFGENYAQEVVSKFTDKKKDYSLHFIGHLQRNKVSKIINIVDSIDSIDSLELLKKVNLEAEKVNKTMNIMFEYNASGDNNKTGFTSVDDLKKTLDETINLKYVKPVGMMTMGPVNSTDSDIRKSFDKFNNIFDIICCEYKNLKLKYKSFGMSADFKLAIEMGSNFLRIGSSVFGSRIYNK